MSEEKKGFFARLKEGLKKTRNNIVKGIDAVFSGFSSIDDDFYEELEEILGKDYSEEDVKKLLEEAVDKINDEAPVFKKIRKVMIRKTDFVKNASKKLIRFAPENKEAE